ncbi:TPA_asm: ead/Ea22-like family protein [Salmonella enterica subsp. enterica]|nr:ead/Ea22-like family protein [Salmonella enterica subsp. enterica serovar Kingston]HAB5171221.1 ead/Ea22-like family protein [Salmonella enterica subsp. enterica]HAB6312380.1 ead/Ea22-like family protein [Salmonella enterica subsp. enterica]
MVERFSMNPVSCKLLNEAWEKEFPDEVAIAERMLALLDENIQLQRGKDAMEAVALALRDDMRDARKQLADAERRNAELDKRLIEYAGIATREARRVAELESRQIALPQRLSPEGYHIDEAYMVDDAEGEYLDRDAVIEAISAAGIKVKE